MVRSLLGADDDWIERMRAYFWPKLHPFLTPFGGYGVGRVYDNQYVTTLDEVGEEEFEEVLVDLGFIRNILACYKTNDHEVDSTGSWVLLAGSDPNGVLGDERQLHVTLFHEEGGGGLDVYAHEEYDWRDRPIAHLSGERFRPKYGQEYMARLLRERGLIA